jgi:hypothetical protein
MPDSFGVRQDWLLGAVNLDQQGSPETQDGHVAHCLSSRFCRVPKEILR